MAHFQWKSDSYVIASSEGEKTIKYGQTLMQAIQHASNGKFGLAYFSLFLCKTEYSAAFLIHLS